MDNNREFWDRWAFAYRSLQQRGNRKLYAELTDLCRPWLREDMDMLELACGSGQFTHTLSGLTASWIATDFSESMVAAAWEKDSPASFAVQDATRLTYENSRFDGVLIANALHIMPEPMMALSEILRVLKPGGLLIAPNFVYEGKVNETRMWLLSLAGFETFYRWDSESFCAYVENCGFRCIGRELVPGKPLSACFAVFRKPQDPVKINQGS